MYRNIAKFEHLACVYMNVSPRTKTIDCSPNINSLTTKEKLRLSIKMNSNKIKKHRLYMTIIIMAVTALRVHSAPFSLHLPAKLTGKERAARKYDKLEKYDELERLQLKDALLKEQLPEKLEDEQEEKMLKKSSATKSVADMLRR